MILCDRVRAVELNRVKSNAFIQVCAGTVTADDTDKQSCGLIDDNLVIRALAGACSGGRKHLFIINCKEVYSA